MDFDPNHVTKNLPGVIGAAIGLRFVSGPTWWHHLSAFAGGCAVSYFGADYAANVSGADIGLVGFVLGLFGMALIAKVHESLQQFKPIELLVEWLRKRWL